MTPTDASSEIPSAPRPTNAYRWAVVVMLWGICVFNYADRMAVAAIAPRLKTIYHFNDAQLGLIGSAFMYVYALTAPFAGQVGDRFPRKQVILGGLYIWSAITGLTALCGKFWQFVLVRGAEGLGETFYFPASMSLISDYHGKKTRSRAMSLHQTGVYVGTVGGSTLAGWLGQKYGWQSPFVLFGVAGVVLGLVLAVFIREPLRNEAEREEAQEQSSVSPLPKREAEGTRAVAPLGGVGGGSATSPPISMLRFLIELRRTPTALSLLFAFFGANCVAQIFLFWMPSFLGKKFHLNLAVGALSATLFIQVASMVGVMIGGVLADRWRRTHAGGRIGAQALGTLLGAPFIVLCGMTLNPWTLTMALTAFGLCKGMYDANIWAGLYDVVAPSRRSSAVGLMNMIGWLGSALGVGAIGALVTYHGWTMGVAIASTAVIYLIVTVALLVAAFVFAPRDVWRAKETRG